MTERALLESMDRDSKAKLAHVGVNGVIGHREAVVKGCKTDVTADANVPSDANDSSGTKLGRQLEEIWLCL